MIKNFLLLFTILFLQSQILHARPIISGISVNKINIDTNFTGAEILLFGAKDRVGEIVIAIRGPKKDFLVSRKEKTFGVWHNGQRIKFQNAYTYYNIFSTFNNQIKNRDFLLSELELGGNNIKFTADASRDKINEFGVKLIENLEQNQLYSLSPKQIDFLDESLFKIMINFPKNIIRGVYTAEIYLINDGNLEDFQAIPIYVNQVGLSAQINDMAHNRSFFYATISVLIAIVAGFVANYIFARFFSR